MTDVVAFRPVFRCSLELRLECALGRPLLNPERAKFSKSSCHQGACQFRCRLLLIGFLLALAVSCMKLQHGDIFKNQLAASRSLSLFAFPTICLTRRQAMGFVAPPMASEHPSGTAPSRKKGNLLKLNRHQNRHARDIYRPRCVALLWKTSAYALCCRRHFACTKCLYPVGLD